MTIDPSVVLAAFGALVAGLGTAARLIYTDMRKDRDEWKALALDSAHDNRRLATAVEAALNIKVPPA